MYEYILWRTFDGNFLSTLTYFQYVKSFYSTILSEIIYFWCFMRTLQNIFCTLCIDYAKPYVSHLIDCRGGFRIEELGLLPPPPAGLQVTLEQVTCGGHELILSDCSYVQSSNCETPAACLCIDGKQICLRTSKSTNLSSWYHSGTFAWSLQGCIDRNNSYQRVGVGVNTLTKLSLNLPA